MKPSLSRCMASLPFVVLLFFSTLSAVATEPAAKKPDPWEPIQSLPGRWEGDVSGESGTGHAVRDYTFVLNRKYIEIRNQSTYPPQEKNPKGEIHEDHGMISYDRAAKKLVLRQFHVEGFVNHYVLESVSPDGRTIIFVTAAIENIPAGWRGRETYEFIDADTFTETFALAEPGKDFATYSQTRFRRVKP